MYLFEAYDGSVSIVYNSTGLSEEHLNKAIKVDSLPIEPKQEGKQAILKIVNKQPVWELIEIPQNSLELRVKKLEQELTDVNEMIRRIENKIAEGG